MALLERVPQLAPAATSSAEAPAPIAPVAIEETGLTQAFIADLVLKILYQKGQATAAELADVICLPLPKILQGILEFLKTEHLVRVFDPSRHRPLVALDARFDRRWVPVARPFVEVGGELTLEDLDLTFDENSKVHEAPFQMKASGGVLLIDDFGRQRASPEMLLNRWIVPLDRDVDFLTLSDGRKIEVPFDVLLVFATNRTPSSLVDEAFLRRIQYKIEVKPPTEQEFSEILRRVCEQQKITFYPKAAEWIAAYARERNIPLRSCHPRDLMQHLGAASRFLLKPAELTPELVELACETYFVPI